MIIKELDYRPFNAKGFIFAKFEFIGFEDGAIVCIDWKLNMAKVEAYLLCLYRRKWSIAQTVGDQYWVFYQLNDINGAQFLIDSMPDDIRHMVSIPDQKTVDYWCVDGFQTG